MTHLTWRAAGTSAKERLLSEERHNENEEENNWDHNILLMGRKEN
jgi:hypothetical protein